MATPLFASLALLGASLPPDAPLDQLFANSRIDMPSLSLGARGTRDSPLLGPPLLPDFMVIPSLGVRRPGAKKGIDLKPVMPVLPAPLLDPKLVHAPKDKDTDFKLTVKEVKVAAAK